MFGGEVVMFVGEVAIFASQAAPFFKKEATGGCKDAVVGHGQDNDALENAFFELKKGFLKVKMAKAGAKPA